MKRFYVPLIALAFVLGFAGSAHAQRVDALPQSSGGSVRIAAVVNDNVISTVDIQSRIRLAMLSSGLPSSSEVANRLFPQVLRSLIDEQLEMQEAKRLDITVPDSEVDGALDHIAHDNQIPGGMKAFIAAHGIPVEALTSQVRNTLAWNKVVQRELRPRVDVGDDEIDAAIERIRANAGKEEFLVSEIFLAVDSPQDEDQVKQFAENLVQQLKEGANFGAVARQFSQGTGAATGGDIGWIQEGQLPQELNKALIAMNKGEIAGPIRTANGFHILGVREKRTIAAGYSGGTVTLALTQAFRPFDPDATTDNVVSEAAQVKATITGCQNLQRRIDERFPAWKVTDMGKIDLDKLPAWASDKVRDVAVGKASDAIPTDKGAIVFFVCDKHVPEGNIDRNAIVNSIGTEKLELQARRLLRDLHRNAYVDIRLATAP